ncbi:MAG: S4 domain-containing protein, partial [Bacteroidales bacterium]|nr:S4 domain-containing protein [Bacteroidales bacterium]
MERKPEKSEGRKPARGEKGTVRGEKGTARGEKRPARKVKAPAKAVVEELVRLNKFIANSGVCARREADELIRMGYILVNGKKVTELGTKVKSTDTVTYKGKDLTPGKKVYILLNKPKGYVTTVKDPHAEFTVL